jgi:predicted O-methyltransferase YrrM
MTDYKFTQDWFHWAPEVWKQLIPMLPGEPGSREFLEIGSFEGRSAVWIVENMMHDGDILGCIDTWEGGEEHGDEDMGTVEERFDHNIAILRAKYPERFIDQYKDTSRVALAEIMQGGRSPTFEFIYIDGSHIAKDVLTDACMAWPLLKPKGIMVFDDYLWGEPRDILHRPKIAVDAFINAFAEEIDIVHVGYQLIVRKREGAN